MLKNQKGTHLIAKESMCTIIGHSREPTLSQKALLLIATPKTIHFLHKAALSIFILSFTLVTIVRSSNVTLKCYDVVREEYDVDNKRQVSIDTRTSTRSQIVSIQVSIDPAFFISSDRGYGMHAEVNPISTGSTIMGIMSAHVLEIA